MRRRCAGSLQEQGLEPHEYVDRIVVAWQRAAGAPERDHDFFIRTSDEGHKRFVQDFLQRIYDNGDDIYEDVYAGLLLRRLRGVQDRGRARRRQVPRSTAPTPSGSRRRTGSSASRPTRSSCSRSTTSGPTSSCRAFRYNEARSFIEGGLQDF